MGLTRGRHKATPNATAPAAKAPAAPAVRAASNGHLQFGARLRTAKLVTEANITEALARQAATGQRLGFILVDLGMLGEEQLAEQLGQHLGLPFADLGDQVPQPEALDRVPESVARETLGIPLRQADGRLEVVVADPTDEVARRLAEAAGEPVNLSVASRSDVLQALDRSYRALADVGVYVKAFEQTERARGPVRVVEDAAAASAESPVVQIVSKVITQALRDRASDIHVEPQDDYVRVRFRIDGALNDALRLPAEIGPALVSRIKILAGMNIVERRRPQDGQIAMQVDGREIDIRVATVATIWGESCVMRLLDKNRSLLELGDLGMPSETAIKFASMVRAPFGMVLCAGPTGSGKTTTLYATLAEINEPRRNIMTIEDPVEYILPSINQIQMNESAGVTFATGLKSILRQDPDVILVGEIRDVETARIAVQSALTGHFVLSSLHATDAVAALHRFLDMGIESFLIASSVMGIVGQRLVRRTCTRCKQKYSPTLEELEFYAQAGGTPKRAFYAGVGCNYCSGTGYRDRVGVYELLRITPEIRQLVVGWATQEELRRLAISQGMTTLQDEGIALAQRDVTTISEVLRAIYAF